MPKTELALIIGRCSWGMQKLNFFKKFNFSVTPDISAALGIPNVHVGGDRDIQKLNFFKKFNFSVH